MSLRKRSVTLGGHRTSIALEQPFWVVLDHWASAEGRSLAGLIAEIDAERAERGGEQPLASALRVAALHRVQRGPSQAG